ncbi:MAG: MFS transporter [Alphaproteobacteria bacterium]
MSPETRRTAGLLTIGLGSSVGPLDTAVNVAFPRITADFGEPMAMIQWVVICYVLTYASLMLVFGKLGDMFGYRRIFVAGLVLSIGALALCALAPSFGWLLFFRGLQGLGTALVLSCGPALATAGFDEDRRARVLGAYTMMYAIASAVGPTVGGVLVEHLGWQGVYWFRVPIAALALALMGFVPKAAPPPASGRFDALGAVLVVASLVAMLLALNMARAGGGLWLGALAVIGFAAFVWQERRSPAPLIKLTPFRSPEFCLVNLASIAVYLVNFAVLLLVPYYLDRLTGLPVTWAGIVLAAGYGGAVVAAPLGGRLAPALGSGRVGFAGAALVAVGTIIIGLWQADTPLWLMLVGLLVSGVGLGFFQVAYMDVVIGQLPRADRGVAGSLTTLTRTIGIVSGVTILTLTFELLRGGYTADGLVPDASFLAAFQATFLWAGGALAAFLALSLLRPRTWL